MISASLLFERIARLTANIKPLLLNSLPDGFLLFGNIRITHRRLWSVLPLGNALMSKQDTVVPGLRVHLYQQSFTWGFRGVLISTGLKRQEFRQ